MCGIAGKLTPDSPPDLGTVRAMCDAQRHRGPDATGLYAAGPVALGVQRLRVLDLVTGDQPLHNETETVSVVMNGEIYNFAQLRTALESRGHVFSSAGDTEVLVHLYEEYGTAMLGHIHGMFAFALWDDTQQQLIVARDRVGKKPLFYSERADGGMSFASELGSLMQDEDIPRALDTASVASFLSAGYISAPYSVWQSVSKLPPAHVLVWRAGRISVTPYWSLSYDSVPYSLDEAAEEVRTVVGAAVQERMLADVPVGAFLSGGLDSSVVVSEMAARSSQRVKTFTIGFDDSPEFDERPIAREVASRFDTDHHELVVAPEAGRLLPDLARHFGEPFGDSSAIPSFYLASLSSSRVTVALNGDGGDEAFGGYHRHWVAARNARLDQIPAVLRKAIASIVAAVGRNSSDSALYQRSVKLGLTGPDRYSEAMAIWPKADLARLLKPEAADAVDLERERRFIADIWASDYPTPLARALALDLRRYLPGDLLPKIDIVTMAHSLEARSPLLDTSVLELAASLPDHLKANRQGGKFVLRHAYRRALPESVLNGRKRGFSVPLGDWLRGDLHPWSRDLLMSTNWAGLISRSEVGSVLDEHVARRRDHGSRIWSLLCLASWLQEYHVHLN